MVGTVGAHSFCLFVFASFHFVVRRTYSLVFASARHAAVVNRVPLVPELGWELYRDSRVGTMMAWTRSRCVRYPSGTQRSNRP